MLWTGCLGVSVRRALGVAMVGCALLAGGLRPAAAAPVTIVALGTSNTYGNGLPRNQAYPAQLQVALKAKGIDARVVNAGVNADTSAGMLARLASAVPNGTRLVLIEIHTNNEIRGGVAAQTSENVAAIKSRLDARHIPWLDISSSMADYVMAHSSPYRLPDNRHLNPEGYARVVDAILPQVTSALGR